MKLWTGHKIFFILLLMFAMSAAAQDEQQKPSSGEQEQTAAPQIKDNHVKIFIDKIEVQGRLEKPQVMLFLPGQTPEIDDIQIERSFIKDIFRPVEKRITVETKYHAEFSKNKKSVIEW